MTLILFLLAVVAIVGGIAVLFHRRGPLWILLGVALILIGILWLADSFGAGVFVDA